MPFTAKVTMYRCIAITNTVNLKVLIRIYSNVVTPVPSAKCHSKVISQLFEGIKCPKHVSLFFRSSSTFGKLLLIRIRTLSSKEFILWYFWYTVFLSVSLCVCICVCLSLPLSLFPSLPLFLSFFIYISLSIYLSVCLCCFLSLFFHLSLSQFMW